MNQAWLITKVHFENNKAVDTFVAVLDANTPSEEIRRMTEELYYTLVDSTTHLPNHKRENAQYRILNDGTPHTGDIWCGQNPTLYARRVYYLFITPSGDRPCILQWREAHIFMQHGKPEVEYWEDFSVTVRDTNDENLAFL